jgi:hypothetical protein
MSKQLFDRPDISGGTHGSHSVYWVPVQVFNTLPIKRWKYNRPPDEDRVTEIRNHMLSSGRMDGIIYLACVNNDLVCYESNHRREALKNIPTLATILVDVLWDATNETVKQEFIRLNKSVSVPELYLSDDPLKVQAEIREVVDQFCKNYKTHKVNTNKPQRPNFNRDNITDEFTRLIQECQIDVQELIVRLEAYNKRLMIKSKDKLSSKIIDKCTESGLWLFAWSTRIDEKEL